MRYIVVTFILSALIFPHHGLTHNQGPDSEYSSVTIQETDGSYYTGQVKNGLKHGRGRYVSADGSEYAGEFLEGKPHGWGIYHHPDGRSKKVLYQSGRLVEARLLSHETDAEGCVYGEFVCLGRYSGWFKGNKIKGYIPHGRGIMKYSNGSVFSGQWVNGKMHGNGSVRWDDGSIYTGQWEMGKRTGYGTYTWPNGDTYTGLWKENQMCGRGIYYYSDGKIKMGIWEEKKVTAGN